MKEGMEFKAHTRVEKRGARKHEYIGEPDIDVLDRAIPGTKKNNKYKDHEDHILRTVYDVMSKGGSLSKVAMILGVTPSRISMWQHEHPNFRAAVEHGENAALAIWEEVGRRAAFGIGNTRENAAMYRFIMKNRFRRYYKDRWEIDVASSNPVVIDFSSFKPEDVQEIIE